MEPEENVTEAQGATEIVGLFESPTAAAAAVRSLMHEHFGECEGLSVTAAQGDGWRLVRIVQHPPTYRLSAMGAALGGSVAALAVAIIGLDFGPFTLTPWGPWWAAFEGGFAGASMGFALGALMSFEEAEPELDFESVGVRSGMVRVKLTARGARGQRAQAILAQAGARDLTGPGSNVTGPYPFHPLAA
jgi:hypothetical protein